MALPSAKEREAFIRAYAVSIGIDPDVAVRVARHEGLGDGIWQSNFQQPYGREQSYGDFQLHAAPEGHRPGLGNTFQAQTGLDPADQSNWQAMDRFALNQARQNGWGPWMGAKAAGVTGMQGIGAEPASPGAMPSRPTETVAQPTGILDPAQPTTAVADVDPMQAGSMWTGYHDKWEALGKMAEDYAKANAPKDEPLPAPLAPLMPLRRITLGKGLLG